MNLGLVARQDPRGLGHVTRDLHDALHPTRTLVVQMDAQQRRDFPQHPEWYPDAEFVSFSGTLPEMDCRLWLEGLDVVYGVETWYDPRFPEWARQAGVRTVLHVMPEFARPEMEPSVVWAPTTWRLDTLPKGTVVVPVPHAAPPVEPDDHDGPLRILHVAGHRAIHDRNGTMTFLRAIREVPRSVGMSVRVECQDRRAPSSSGAHRVVTRLGGRDDRWEMYRDADVLVLPRRYGGLSLVCQEAMAMGLAVVMPDVPPNAETWPVATVPARRRGSFNAPGGEIDMWDADTSALARLLADLANDPEQVATMKKASREWAAANSWDALRPLYERRLREVMR